MFNYVAIKVTAMNVFQIHILSTLIALFLCAVLMPEPLSTIYLWSCYFATVFFTKLLGKKLSLLMCGIYSSLVLFVWFTNFQYVAFAFLPKDWLLIPEILVSSHLFVVVFVLCYFSALYVIFEIIIKKLKLRERVGVI